MTEPRARSMMLLKFGITGLAVAAYFYVPGVQQFSITGIYFLKNHQFEELRTFILSYGIWAPVTSIALMALQSLVPFVPGLIITVTNAWIFGWHFGALYSWIGALAGAMIDFGIASWFGRPVVEKFISPKYLAITNNFFHKHGVLAVFITRIIPVIPFKVISYGAGLTAISSLEFMVATGIGQTPGIIVYSILGQHLVRSIRTTILVTSLMVAAGILIYYYRRDIEKFIYDKD